MDWSTIIPNLVGGAITAGTAGLLFYIAHVRDSANKRAERRKTDAMAAFSGLQKLSKAANYIGNLDKHINDLFIRAHEEGSYVSDPASLIVPIILAPAVIEDLTPSESKFLVDRDGEFLARAFEIQERARVIESIVSQYNRMRMEYDEFLETKAHGIKEINGSVLSIELNGADALVANLRMGRLNQLATALVVALDTDKAIVVEICTEYVRRAREKYGEDFPVVSFELRVN